MPQVSKNHHQFIFSLRNLAIINSIPNNLFNTLLSEKSLKMFDRLGFTSPQPLSKGEGLKPLLVKGFSEWKNF